MPDSSDKIKSTTPQLPIGLWVLSLYFIEGLPYTIVNIVSVALFKTMQVDNGSIGLYTSLFYIPWTIKFLWAPLIDYTGNRRQWIIVLQMILAIITLVLSVTIFYEKSFAIISLVFALIAFISATYDTACDGYYLDILNKSQQALYVGIRNTAYKIAWLFGSGVLVYLAGQIASNNFGWKILGSISNYKTENNIGWSIVFFIAALVFFIAAIFHFFALPNSSTKEKSSSDLRQATNLIVTAQSAFHSFFQQPKIGLILLWILLFRTGDALLLKMAQPFFLDAQSAGGLGLTLSEVGFIYGSIGIICLLIGGIVGGWLVFKYGLKKCLFPAAILQSLTILLYWLLAIFQPGQIDIALANAFEQFVYGLATAAYISYLFTIVKEEFRASHYAMATGLMAVGMLLPGTVSGYLVDNLGYQQFFLFSFFCSLPGILCTTRLPFLSKN